MVQTVREFVSDAYQIISANSPTVPLHGNDLSKGIQFLNELMQSYSATGLMITVPKEVTTNIVAGTTEVTFAESGADVNEGRLANLEDAWLVLENVTYPLIPVSESEFYNTYRYQPLLGLPIYCIFIPRVEETKLILYPAASQGYELHVYGKFQLPVLTSNDTMAELPLYYSRYLKLALARELAVYKSRIEAWSDRHEKIYIEAKKDMESVSNFNLDVNDPNENQLNGSYRIRAGI